MHVTLVSRFLAAALLCFNVVAAGTAGAADEIDPEHRKKIVALMEIIGAENITRQVSLSVTQQLAYGLKQAEPDLDEKAFRILASITEEEIEARSDEMIEKMVPLYAKHFTEDELDELLAFYRSPIGRKTTETMPKVMQESMELAATESQSAIPKIKERVTARLREDGLLGDE
jgi:hypothetical protein